MVKINTTRQRLALYKRALKYYTSDSFDETNGFCYYFKQFGIRLYYGYFYSALPELYAQKPEIVGFHYWFPVDCGGKDKPRIKALKGAIKLCEKNLAKNLRK